MSEWPREIYDVLKEADIRQVSYVPDAGHARLIEMCTNDNEIRSIPLATELEGIGIAAGAWLGGERAAPLMPVFRSIAAVTAARSILRL